MTSGTKDAPSYSPLVDAYIACAQPFAQPILNHLRALIHNVELDVEEGKKWSRPFFLHHGIILGNMSAFKEHCSVGFWGEEITALLRADGLTSSEAMGSLGRLTELEDLPSDDTLLHYFQHGARAIASGERTKSITRTPQRVAKPELETPPELEEALKKNKVARENFENFTPSRRREYNQWIADAKRDETRSQRVTQTVDWLVEGERRNWKHEDC